MCGKMRPHWARKPSICGLVRKDASKDGRGALHLSPCAERRGPIGHESRVSVAMCGKTRPHWARKPSICGHVRKDEAPLGTKAQHLWPCAERREQGRPWPAAA